MNINNIWRRKNTEIVRENSDVDLVREIGDDCYVFGRLNYVTHVVTVTFVNILQVEENFVIVSGHTREIWQRKLRA